MIAVQNVGYKTISYTYGIWQACTYWIKCYTQLSYFGIGPNKWLIFSSCSSCSVDVRLTGPTNERQGCHRMSGCHLCAQDKD